MGKKQIGMVTCQICNKQKKLNEVAPAELVSEPVVEIIKKTYPDWSTNGYICSADLNLFWAKYVKRVLENQKGELSPLDEQVLKSFQEKVLLSKNINSEFDKRHTFSERMADSLSDFAGSWVFIFGFAAFLIAWIVLNIVMLSSKPFDPYPFILLNLVLSCLAAIQAPVILMSQNRLESRDRIRSELDYRINLKTELEIRHLHEKLDNLLVNQWQKLLDIQENQTELIEELTRRQKLKE